MLVSASLGVAATAQETSTSQSPAEGERTVTIGTATDIRTTNPLRSLTGIEAFTFSFMYSGMLWMDQNDLSSVPGLVE